MAPLRKTNKEESEPQTSRFDFILPLEPHELRNMWDEYTDGKQIKNFRAKNGRSALAEYVFYNREKVMSYNSETGEWSIYQPDNQSSEDTIYKFERAKRHWKQFEEYARKRQFAIQQDANYQPIENKESEVKLMGFYGE